MNSARTTDAAPSGILLIDKPAGLTSHDVVARTRRLAGTRKVGHAGTLDPMATGLLLLGVNSATRLLTYIVGLDKEYLATVRLGAATVTDDAEGDTTVVADPGAVAALTEAAVVAAFAAQTGTIVQVPSAVSAIKVDGKRAYARVRAGEDVQLKGREVTISELELLGPPEPATMAAAAAAAAAAAGDAAVLDVRIRVVCSSGTYIRAIGRDVGEALGVGGHLTALRRTRIGPFAVADAPELADLQQAREGGEPLPLLEPAAVAAALYPVLALDAEQAIALGHGQRIALPEHPDGLLAAVTGEGRLLGIVQVAAGRGKSVVNFPPEDYRPAVEGSRP